MQRYSYNSTLRQGWNRIQLFFFGFWHSFLCTKSFADKIFTSMMYTCYVYLVIDACSNNIIPSHRQTYIYTYIYKHDADLLTESLNTFVLFVDIFYGFPVAQHFDSPSYFNVIYYNYTFSITSLASCQCKKHIQNSLHCHRSTAPSYVADMQHRWASHTRNTRSSSYTMPLLNQPAHSKETLGDRSFYIASSSVWNSIPNDVRRAPSLSSLKSRLKTYLFSSIYKDWSVSLITVHMCLVWPCYGIVDSLS